MSSMSSSPSSTPMVLTPDTTGDHQSQKVAAYPPGKMLNKTSRRQTAVYNPAASSLNLSLGSGGSSTSNGSGSGSTASASGIGSGPPKLKPFSRSAAKRESVLALGSIEHLQHYFSQAGIASKRNPLLEKFRNQGLVPAIGGLGHVPLSPVEDESSAHIASLDALLAHQQQNQQAQQILSPHVRTHEVHPDSLLPGVIDGLAELVTAWSLEEEDSSRVAPSGIGTGTGTSSTIDTLSLLKISTRAIYNVRNYVLSLDEDSTATIRERVGKTTHTNPPPQGSATAVVASKSVSPAPTPPPLDPLAQIRRSALEVLASLRELEERARLPLSDEAYDAQSDGGGGGSTGSTGQPASRMGSPSPPLSNSDLEYQSHHHHAYAPHPLHDPSITFSFVQVNGKVESVPVWVNEDDFDPFEDDEKKPKERWDERLELGNGWLYRGDVTWDEVEKERGVVRAYVGLVDAVLFSEDGGSGGRSGEGPGNGTERNFQRARRRLEARASRLLVQSTGDGPLGRRSRSKNRRVSAGEAIASGSAAAQALFIDTKTGGMRRISTGVLGLGKSQTEEPEAMECERERVSEWGAIREEDEEGEGEETTDEVEDDELPEWARRGSFSGDDLGRAYSFLKHFLPQAYQYALVPPSDAFELPPPSPSPYSAPDIPPSTLDSEVEAEDGAQTQPPRPRMTASRTNFLSSLSSGQLLCFAYNACVRKSRHPWGFVSKEGIHDVLGLEAREREREAIGRERGVRLNEGKEKDALRIQRTPTGGGGDTGDTPVPSPPKPNRSQPGAGWTFRRTDNLRLWAGGLKLRYTLPVQMPSQVISVVPPSLLQLPTVQGTSGGGLGGGGPVISRNGNSSQGSGSNGSGSSPISRSVSQDKDKDKIVFDAKVVARRDEGWEDMLQEVLLRWMWKAVEEVRRG